MKISVIGNIIDTKDIYQITPIEGDNCWAHMSNNKLVNSAYRFKIKLFNQKSITVNLSGYDVYPSDGMPYWWKNDYEAKINTVYNKVNMLRDKLIVMWNENGNNIPRFEF